MRKLPTSGSPLFIGLTLLLLALFMSACEPKNGKVASTKKQVQAPPPPVPFPPVPEKITDYYQHCLSLIKVAKFKIKNFDKPLFDEARIHERFGHDDEAIKAYQKAVDVSPSRSDAYMSIGFLLSQKNKFTEAAEAYHTALAINPKEPGAQTRLGLIHIHEGQVPKAIEAYKKEIENKSANADTYNFLGQAYLQNGDNEEALKVFKKCIQLNKDHLNGHYGLSQALRALQKPEESAKMLARFKELRKIEKEAEEKGADNEKANQGQKDRRSTAETYYDISQTYQLVNLKLESLQMLQGSLIFDPKNIMRQTLLIDLHRKEGNLQAALEQGKKAVEVIPDDDKLLYLVAGLYSDSKDILNSGKLLQRAVRANPNNIDALRELARTIMVGKLFGKRSAEQALIYAKKAVEIKENSTNLDILAWVQYAGGDKESARISLQRALELDPKNQAIKTRLEQLESSQ